MVTYGLVGLPGPEKPVLTHYPVMAARILVGTGTRYLLNQLIVGHGAYSVTLTGGNQLLTNIPFGGWPPASFSFPFGLPVEPDAPT